jgi:hypothetical protein
VHDQGTEVALAAWQAAPYHEDLNSVMAAS